MGTRWRWGKRRETHSKCGRMKADCVGGCFSLGPDISGPGDGRVSLQSRRDYIKTTRPICKLLMLAYNPSSRLTSFAKQMSQSEWTWKGENFWELCNRSSFPFLFNNSPENRNAYWNNTMYSSFMYVKELCGLLSADYQRKRETIQRNSLYNSLFIFCLVHPDCAVRYISQPVAN